MRYGNLIRGAGSLYADLSAYDVTELTSPFDPGRYIQSIHGTAEAGYRVLIIDSLTHMLGPGKAASWN
ncbi:hypothetical protein SAMN05660653_02135 [Desulfonatronum thiosulfatophilum]|uniref:Uncharacterized protein n=1 Tax=Desulfonatronum thiosulfatophilum TaxID=617002 RepID=A0A1G6DH98_9BACT|nr:hypothetical protein SAMN05660653_02135 [Desulfonatronum thiosulfatophilum]